MAVSGFTSLSVVNGVQEMTSANNITGTATATDEQFLITGSGTGIRASGSGQVSFTRCNIFINDLNPSPNLFWQIQYTSISYNADNGDRSVLRSTRSVSFVDSSIVFRTTTGGLRAIFIGDMTNTLISHEGNASVLFYSQTGANLDNMHIQNCSWEVNGAPGSASNVRIENSGEGVVNFFLPRLDLAYINQINVNSAARLGTGNSGNVQLYLWNRVSADNTTINFQSVNNEYFDGITASWEFTDRDNGTPVSSNLKVLVSSDKSGSMTQLAEYSTDSNGHLFGTYDSQFETSGASQTRDTLYFFENYSDTSGTTHGGVGPYLTYDIINVTNRVEIRAYLYEAPVGYLLGDDYALTTPQGALNPDGTVSEYQTFIMNNDLNLTELNTATVSTYTDIDTIDKLYDRQKLGWYNTDAVALLGKQGAQIVLGAKDLTLDATAGAVWAATLNSVTVKSTTYTGGATATTGKVTTLNGALLSGGVFNCDIDYQSGSSTTITGVTCTGVIDLNTAGNYTFDNCTATSVTNSSGGAITINLTNGSTISSVGASINLVQNVTISAPNILDDSRIRIFNVTKSIELDNSIVSGGSGVSFTANLLSTDVDDGDTIELRASYQVGVIGKLGLTSTGVITASGLTFIDSQVDDTVFNTIGVDGSTVTEFDHDFVNNEIDIVVAANFSAHRLYARFVYFTTLPDGIRLFFGAVEAVDLANIKNDVTVLDMFLNNNTATNVIQTDNVRLYKSNGVYPARTATTGGGGIDVVWRNQILIAQTGTSGLTAAEAAQLDSIDKLTKLIPDTL